MVSARARPSSIHVLTRPPSPAPKKKRMTYELVLPIILRTKPHAHARLFHSSNISASARSILVVDGGQEQHVAYGYKHGAVVLGTKGAGPKYILKGHKCRITHIYFASLQSAEEVILSLSADGVLCCWGVSKGSCIRSLTLPVVGDEVKASCLAQVDGEPSICKLFVGWATKPYIIVVDVLNDFRCERSAFDLLHGVLHLEIGRQGEAEVLTLHCVDAQLNAHSYDASTLEFISSNMAAKINEDDLEQQLPEARRFLGELDMPKKKFDKHLVLLSPGNIAVNLDGLKVHAATFPTGKGIVSPKQSDEVADKSAKLVDPHWEFFIPGIKLIDGIDGICSDRVVLAIVGGKVAAWLIRIFDPKHASKAPVIQEIMPWSRVAPGVECSPLDYVSACEKLAMRQHPTDRKMTEARGLFSIIQARMVTVMAIKETLAFTADYETCKTSWNWAVLHRIPFPFTSRRRALKWDSDSYLLHIADAGTWNLVTGELERVPCAVRQNEEYFRDRSSMRNRRAWLSNIRHFHPPHPKLHFPRLQRSKRKNGSFREQSGMDESPRSSPTPMSSNNKPDETETKGKEPRPKPVSEGCGGSAGSSPGFIILPLENGDVMLTVRIKSLLREMCQLESSLALGQMCGGALSLLMQWGMNTELDQQCIEVFGLAIPRESMQLSYSYVVDTLNSTDMFVSLWHCAGEATMNRWAISDKLTALHAIGLMSLFIGAMARFQDDAHAQAVLSSLVTHYGIVYPEHFKKMRIYRHPSLSMIAKCALDRDSHDVQVAARLLLQVSIERLPTQQRLDAMKQWAAQVHEQQQDFTTAKQSHIIMILGVMGVTHPEDMDPVTAKSVTHALAEYITHKTPNCISFAAELLAQGYHLWFPYINDRQKLIQDLLHHSETQSSALDEAAVATANKVHNTLSVGAACQRALIEIGTKQPLDFMKTIGREAIRPDVKSEHHQRALKSLAALIKKQPIVLVNHLPALVEVIIKTLDPSEASLRKACLKSSTMVLHSLVKRYPMVAFHQHTQRFAVGSSDNIIVIYDLRTATKWRILEGHTGPVTAVCFEPKSGDKLATYSSTESAVRIWQTGTSGIFSTILGIKGKCIQMHQLPPASAVVPMIQQLQFSTIKWDQNIVRLVRETSEIATFSA